MARRAALAFSSEMKPDGSGNAGTRMSCSATWVITIPTQHELIGGNRRES